MTDGFTIEMDLQEGYRFVVEFGDDLPPLLMDEPAPLGDEAGPNAVRALAAAVGNCLSASALYCLRRAHIDVLDMHTTVGAATRRNEQQGRLRVGGFAVRIEPVVAEDDQPRMRRCMELFEDFCVVTQSVREGIEVSVAVEPASPAAALSVTHELGDDSVQLP